MYTYTTADGTLAHDSLNSADENGTAFWGHNAFGPHLSSDGLFLGFNSAAWNLDTPEITVQNLHTYVKARTSRTLTRASRHDGGTDNCDGGPRIGGSSAPFVSTDGNTAVFNSSCAFTLDSGAPADTNGFADVFVRDITAMTATRISLVHDGTESDGDTTAAAISSDARYVLIRSAATNLVSDDPNAVEALFVHDTMMGMTVRVTYDGGYGELIDDVYLVRLR